MTSPKGANFSLSNLELSTLLKNICVVRVPGPAIAKVTVPRVLLAFTGSSAISFFHLRCLSELPLIPS